MKSFSKLFQPKMLVATLVMAALTVAGLAVATPKPAQAASTNDIIYGGFATCNAADFVNKYKNGVHDLDEIYGHFGLPKTNESLNYFLNNAKCATAYKDGRIVLDNGDVIVPGGAQSAGRQPITGNYKVMYANGIKLHYGENSGNFGTSSLKALVLLDPLDHSLKFGVLSACGNPTWGTSPGYYCDQLIKEQVNENTFKFSTKAFTKNGATVEKVVYDFGDGSAKVTKTNPSEKVTHTYKPGKWTAKVTVYFKVNGKTKTHTRVNCEKEVEAKEKKVPEFACTSIKTIVISGTERKYQFVGTAEHKHAKVLSATFDFGDGTTAPGQLKEVSDNETEITSPVHQYKEFNGKKFIQLSVKFDKGEDKNNPKCKTEIAREILDECIPKEGEDENCKPKEEVCEPKKGEDENCVKLPDTGPTEILAAAAGVSGLGAAGAYYRASRKNLSSVLNKFKQ